MLNNSIKKQYNIDLKSDLPSSTSTLNELAQFYNGDYVKAFQDLLPSAEAGIEKA